ncbi:MULTISPECIES: hypothetical protein [Sphingomonas]|uniref:Uncharacterized protein n=1 Tax=Sphingomonas albertensis TaxID=2762591 RepID=A0ABR7AKL7_9SPHN|nr:MULTISPECIES: hypothetical protein [Sphingomonas]MBC3941004.1 hypothetical protein [Sphingomonas albertensis]MCP8890866.1 hypothetical protein [Sphingomonas faeni]
MQTSGARTRPSAACALGRHTPRSRHRDIKDEPIQRSACRRCGATIVKSAVSRRWIVSGLLG